MKFSVIVPVYNVENYALEEMGAKCEYIDYLNEARENAYDMGYQLKDAVRKHDPGRIVRTVVGLRIFCPPIDYDKVDRLLQPYLEYSREYLRRAAYSEPDLPVTDAVEDNSMEKKA